MIERAKTAFSGILSMALPAAGVSPQGDMTDEDAVRAAVTDYVQGWYEADGERMRRSLHPDLAKRGLVGEDLQPISAADLVDLAKNGMGKNQAGKREKVITVLDIADDIATAKVVSDQFNDYLHLGKVRGRWAIVNVLWAYRKR